MIRRAIARMLRPVWRLLVRVAPVEDPWERLSVAPKLYMYGSGARLDFPKYLTGSSAVSVTSIEQIQDWLLDCRYERDEVLFAEPDFWQHATTFEHLRAADCEDFALWAWRKLIELGIDADIVAGYRVNDGDLGNRHAWVVFRQDGVEYLFEAVDRTRTQMIRPLVEVREEYLPQFGADRTGHRFAFSGYLAVEKRLLERKGGRRSA